MALTGEEIQRKVLHFIFGTILPVGIFYLPMLVPQLAWLPKSVPGWVYPPAILGLTLAGFAVVEYARLKIVPVQKVFHGLFGSMLRHEEKWKVTGATWINASALICSLIFCSRPDVSFMVLSTFIWGDAVAALVGQSIGRTRIGAKSLEGSLSCLVLCLIFFFAVFPHVPLLLDAWGGQVPWPIAVAISLCITILELIPLRITKRFVINDNLAVPVIAGLLMLALSRHI